MGGQQNARTTGTQWGSRMLGPRGLRVFQIVCSPLFTWACMHGEKGFSMTCEQGEYTFLHFV